MLELDLLLVPFVEREVANLSAEQLEQLESLLSLDDVELLELLTMGDVDDAIHSDILEVIRQSNSERGH